MTNLTKIESALLVGFVAVVCFPLLYLARRLDDNTLSSWRWVFNGQSIGAIILFCLLAVFLSFLLSRTSIFERQPVISLLALSFLSCFSLWGVPELLLDSGRYFLQAKQVSEYGVFYFVRQWGKGIQAWTDMPLGPLVYGMIFGVFGENRLLIQLFNSLLFSLSTVLTFLSARILIGKENSLYAGLFLLGMPYLLIQVPLLLVDIHALFFFSLALYTFLTALNGGGVNSALWAAVSILLAMLSKYSTWPMLLILPALLIGFRKIEARERLRRAGRIFLLAALFASILFIPKLQVMGEQISLLKNYQQPALLEWREGLMSTFFFQIHPFITLFACVAFLGAIRKRNGFLLVIGLFILLFSYQVARIRYIVPLLPLLAIMAAAGLKALQFSETRRLVCWLSVTFSFVILHQAYLPFFQQTSMGNIQSAGSYLDSLGGDMVEVATLPQAQSKAPTFITIPQLDLFTRKKIIARQSWSAAANRPQGYHPLLFTWAIKRPSYYDPPGQASQHPGVPLVVISGKQLTDSLVRTLRGNVSPGTVKRFSNTSKVFRFKTFVTVIP